MIHRLQETLQQAGFDLCDPLHTDWYNDLIEEEGHTLKGTLKKIPSPQPINESGYCYNAVLIGNSKSIWPKFISWLKFKLKNDALAGSSDESNIKDDDELLHKLLGNDPFDTFVTESLSKVFKSFSGLNRCGEDRGNISSNILSYEVFWSHGLRRKVIVENDHADEVESEHKNTSKTKSERINDKENSSFLVCLQRVAKVTGNYWHDDEGTKLCIHPRYGTWTAFRCLIVFHTTIQNQNSAKLEIRRNPPPWCPCPADPKEIDQGKEMIRDALSGSNQSYGSLCKVLHNTVSSGSNWSEVSPRMRPWIELRDCISVGRQEYKYSDNQLLYHYTKDPEILKEELLC